MYKAGVAGASPGTGNENKKIGKKHRKTCVCSMFWKIPAFGHFWPNSGGRRCQKEHLDTKTIHLNLLPGLYVHPLQRNSPEKLMFQKTADFWHFGQKYENGPFWAEWHFQKWQNCFSFSFCQQTCCLWNKITVVCNYFKNCPLPK